MSGDGTDSAYAPKSPDLSSFDLPGPTPPAEPPDPRQLLTLSQQSEQSQSNFSHLQPPASPYFPSPHQQPTHAPHPGQQHHHQLATPPHSRAQARPTSYPSTTRTPSFDFARGQHPDTSAAHHTYFPSPSRVPTQPLPGYTAPAPAPPPQQPSFYQPPPYGANYQYQYQQHQQFPPQTPNLTANLTAAQAQARQSYSYPSGFGERPVGGSQAQHQPQLEHPPLPPHHHTMPPRRAAAAAAAAQMAAAAAAPEPDHELEPMADEIRAAPAPAPASAAAAAAAAGGGVVEAGPVKTKFPTARIKRIMQADEEVGKVAQQTPIAVGKALELFMVALVTKSAEVARQRSSKRVSAQMLKQVVESDDQWDFLRDIVSKVEVGEEKAGKGGAGGAGSGAGGTRVKAESESEDEAAAAGAAGGKRKRGGGRKKKVKGEM